MWLYIALGLIAIIYYLYKNSKYDYWEKKGVPTASGNERFFGHHKPILLAKKHTIEVYDDIYKEFPDEPLVGFYTMNLPSLMVKDLDIIKTIFISEFSSFNTSGFIVDPKADPMSARHPFMLRGEEWKTARNQVNPSLTLSKLKGYLPGILNVGDEMVKYVLKNCKSRAEMETRELAMLYGTDVTASILYGIENNTFINKDSLVANITREIRFDTNVVYNIIQQLQSLPIINKYFPIRFASQQLQHAITAVTRKVVKERVASGEKRNDLIQLLLQQKENDTKGVIDDVYIMSAQVFIFILDLFETASNIISNLLYLLSIYPEIQEKLRSEIKNVKSRKNGEFAIEDIEGAKYLDMVYNDEQITVKVRCGKNDIWGKTGKVQLLESFRLFSLMLMRECTADCYVPRPGSEPYKITKGTSIIIPVNSIHKDPKYYTDPEKFDPERFSAEEVAKRPKFTFLPFGEGPKKCIGYRLTALHTKVAIIKIIDSFQLTPSPKTTYPFVVDPCYPFTYRIKGGAWVLFEPINN